MWFSIITIKHIYWCCCIRYNHIIIIYNHGWDSNGTKRGMLSFSVNIYIIFNRGFSPAVQLKIQSTLSWLKTCLPINLTHSSLVTLVYSLRVHIVWYFTTTLHQTGIPSINYFGLMPIVERCWPSHTLELKPSVITPLMRTTPPGWRSHIYTLIHLYFPR